jgi:hypothetical protein
LKETEKENPGSRSIQNEQNITTLLKPSPHLLPFAGFRSGGKARGFFVSIIRTNCFQLSAGEKAVKEGRIT